MNNRSPQPSQQAQILRSFFASQGIIVRPSLALEAIARVSGYDNTQALRADTPEDTELATFMDSPQATTGTRLKPESKHLNRLEVQREALSNVRHFVADNFPRIDYAQRVVYHGADRAEENCGYSGITLTVCLESDAELGREAPFAYYAKQLNTHQEGWTNRAIPESDEIVTDLSVKVLLRAIQLTGIRLTAVYDESPQRET